jgi:hypothetical protein
MDVHSLFRSCAVLVLDLKLLPPSTVYGRLPVDVSIYRAGTRQSAPEWTCEATPPGFTIGSMRSVVMKLSRANESFQLADK